MKKNTLLLISMTVFSLLFLISIALDITPLLRGPAPYPPDWQWPYQFTNTVQKIWFPSITIFFVLLLFRKVESMNETIIRKYEKLILLILCLSHIVFQFSVLYFSRAGISVILQRIINPDSNGYFTTALSVTSVFDFLKTYNDKVLSFPMHATGHPPGSVFFFWLINQLASLLTPFFPFIKSLRPVHGDIRIIWDNLTVFQRLGASMSALIIPFFSSLAIPLVYYAGKMLYNIKSSFRASFLYVFIPSIILFNPLSDVFFPLLFLLTFFIFVKALQSRNPLQFFLSGMLFFISLFFSMSLLPLSLILGYFLFKFSVENKTRRFDIMFFFRYGIVFSAGFVIFPSLLFITTGFNAIELAKTLMSGLPKGRLYRVWVIYNLYDFFIFVGIPLALIYFNMLWNKTKDHLWIAFTIMLIILDVSGAVRGEVGRIWIPFVSIPVLFTANYLTIDKKLITVQFGYLLLLQAIQILVMQEFWAPLW